MQNLLYSVNGVMVFSIFNHNLTLTSIGGYGTLVQVEWDRLRSIRSKADEDKRCCPAVQNFEGRASLHAAFSVTVVSNTLQYDANGDRSGLSLVDATHCFLVEPLINSAIELQAVSRIHRLGQTKPVSSIDFL